MYHTKGASSRSERTQEETTNNQEKFLERMVFGSLVSYLCPIVISLVLYLVSQKPARGQAKREREDPS